MTLSEETARELVTELRRLSATLDRVAVSLDPPPSTAWITPHQAASLLPFGDAAFMRALIARGDVDGSKVGGRWVTTRAAVETYVQSRSTTPATRRRRRRAI